MDRTPDPMAAGFANAPVQSAWTFRAILEAMSRPGRIQHINVHLDPPQPLYPSTAAVALTLLDFETKVWMDDTMAHTDVVRFLKFHCGCTMVDDPSEAAFGLIAAPAQMPPLEAFNQGTPDYPDRSTTLVVQTASLSDQADVVLAGPGIETVHSLSAPSLGEVFWREMQVNNKRYPLGVDVVITAPSAIAACPRSTSIQLPKAA